MLCAHCSPEPTPSPSQEGSNTGWPVPLLGGVRGTAVELSQLRGTWSAEFIPLPADLHVPRGGGLKSALLNSTAVGPSPARDERASRKPLA